MVVGQIKTRQIMLDVFSRIVDNPELTPEIHRFRFQIGNFVWDVRQTKEEEHYISYFQYLNYCFNGAILDLDLLLNDAGMDFNTVVLDGLPCIRVRDMVALSSKLAPLPKYSSYKQLRIFVENCAELTIKENRKKEIAKKNQAKYEREYQSYHKTGVVAETAHSFKQILAQAQKRQKANGFSK